MSSFKAKVEKQKSARAARKETPSGTSTPKEPAEGTTEPTPEQVPAVTVATEQASPSSTEEYYGEDQQEEVQGKPKFERAIPLDRIRPNPHQHRQTFDPTKLEELAAGMRIHGWVGGGLPVRAHPTEANIYELVWGERRWRAARMAGLATIPCVVSDYSDNDLIEKGLLENIQREDLSNLEEGLAYVSLLALRTESGKPRYSIRRLATQIGKDKSYIEDRLQYARVPIDIQQLAEDQPDISPRIIRELGELSKMLPPEERAPVIEGVRAGKLRIEDVREIRQDIAGSKTVSISTPIDQLIIHPGEEGYSPESERPVTASVATDILLTTEERTSGIEQEPVQPVAPLSPPSVAVKTVDRPSPTLLTPTIVFEKSLKRDHEAIDRILLRLQSTMTSLTRDEQAVLVRYLKRWNGGIKSLLRELAVPEAEE